MTIPTDFLWLGNQASAEAYINAVARVEALPSENKASSDMYQSEAGSEKETHYLLSVQNGVGIIDIAGSLVSGNAGYSRYFGLTGYEDIADAAMLGLRDQTVEAFVLNIGSPGGAVAGVSDLAQFLDNVRKVKPVVTYSGANMASAALWVGCTADYVVTGDTSILGSLGVIRVHFDRSEQLKMNGIKATVIRAGAKKALASPYEPLTEAAKAQMEEQAAQIYDVFLPWVASHRGVSDSVAESKFGQGQEFVGKWAVSAGLADKVGTLDMAVEKARSLGAAKKRRSDRSRTGGITNITALPGAGASLDASLVNNSPNTEGTPMPKPYTPEELAAIAAGVTLPVATAPSAPEAASATAPEATSATTTETAAEASEAQAEAPAAAVQATLDVKASPEYKALEGLYTAQQASLVEVQVQLAKSKEDLAASAAVLTPFTEIVRNSVRSMTVALNGNAALVEGLTASALQVEHARLSVLFLEKFKAGAVAAPAEKTGEPSPGNPAPSARSMTPQMRAMAKSVPVYTR